MANLAIKGHSTRGKEVIEILEMLGAVNIYGFEGDIYWKDYCIVDDGIEGDMIWESYYGNDSVVFTLEEFLKKFPYKVGDKVIDMKTNRIVEIYKAHWSESNNCTYYDVKRPDNTGCVRSYKFLQPYK